METPEGKLWTHVIYTALVDLRELAEWLAQQKVEKQLKHDPPTVKRFSFRFILQRELVRIRTCRDFFAPGNPTLSWVCEVIGWEVTSIRKRVDEFCTELSLDARVTHAQARVDFYEEKSRALNRRLRAARVRARARDRVQNPATAP